MCNHSKATTRGCTTAVTATATHHDIRVSTFTLHHPLQQRLQPKPMQIRASEVPRGPNHAPTPDLLGVHAQNLDCITLTCRQCPPPARLSTTGNVAAARLAPKLLSALNVNHAPIRERKSYLPCKHLFMYTPCREQHTVFRMSHPWPLRLKPRYAAGIQATALRYAQSRPQPLPSPSPPR